MIAILITALIALSTLAFGAVYPWAYLPLFASAAVVGVGSVLRRHHALAHVRPLALSLLLLVLAVCIQLVPLTSPRLEAVSPRAPEILSSYSLPYAAGGTHPVSIEPRATQVTFFGLACLALYLVGAPAALVEGLRALPRNVMLFAVPLAIFGIISRENNNGLVYWFWEPRRGGGGNIFGPFINRNHFAGWMLMATCLAIGLLLGQLERARQDPRWNWRKRALWLSSSDANRILLSGFSIGVMAISLVWTLSRSGITSFSVAISCFAWLVACRRHLGGKRRTVAVMSLSLVLVGGIGWRGLDRVLNWFADTQSLTSRLAAWQDGWRVVQDFAFAGTGLNTYSTAMLFYQKSNSDVHLAQAHNDYLQLMAEGGLLVTPLAAIAALCLVVVIRRSLNAAAHECRGYWIRAGAAVGLIGIAVQETVEFSLQMPANAFLFCTLAAIAMAPVNAREDRTPTA